MKLFLVVHDDEDGNNRDLHVWAERLDEVADLWADFFELDKPESLTVFEVNIPTTTVSEALSWDIAQEGICP